MTDGSARAQKQTRIRKGGSEREATTAPENDRLKTHPETIQRFRGSRHQEKNPVVRTPRGF
jgi:hypothetical protein